MIKDPGRFDYLKPSPWSSRPWSRHLGAEHLFNCFINKASSENVLLDSFTMSTDGSRASQVALVVKNPPVSAGDLGDTGLILGLGRSPGGGMATHSSILAWRIPWTEEPGGLQSVWLQRVGHDWSDSACIITWMVGTFHFYLLGASSL